MLHGLLGPEPGEGAPAGSLDRSGDRADLVLDRRQADHGVQLGHGLINGDLRLPVCGGPLTHGRCLAALSVRRVPGADQISGLRDPAVGACGVAGPAITRRPRCRSGMRRRERSAARLLATELPAFLQ